MHEIRAELRRAARPENAAGAQALRSREFFLRKAIGWALRQYAWTDPREVARYVRAYQGALSPLSRREALKNVPTGLRSSR